MPINPFNFFGYFTIQSNLIITVVYLLTAIRSSDGPRGWLTLARACATAYLIVVGIVYALLLAPLGAALVFWASRWKGLVLRQRS